VRVVPGCYGVFAFEDANENGHYDAEPGLSAASPDRFFELGTGQRQDVPDLAIPADGRLAVDAADPTSEQVLGLVARSQEEQLLVSLQSVAVEGERADLSDPRFGAQSARLGYFDPLGFGWQVGPGVYFLEDYDPHKIPVLFVHGALGHPSEFESLVKGLDRTHYQPWFFFYPSGARLSSVSELLSQLVTRLRLRLRFARLAVVAHSMGGLVARSFILKHHEEAREDPVELFVAISTPWDGSEAAQSANREPSPLFPASMRVPMWQDIATNSAFLNHLFFVDGEPAKGERPLPPGLEFDLLFGVLDRTISLSSAARWEAVRQARERWPLVEDHTSILRSPDASKLLGGILQHHFGPG
jgi:pimeloyl-ACP methyl ester carboxylesterase